MIQTSADREETTMHLPVALMILVIDTPRKLNIPTDTIIEIESSTSVTLS